MIHPSDYIIISDAIDDFIVNANNTTAELVALDNALLSHPGDIASTLIDALDVQSKKAQPAQITQNLVQAVSFMQNTVIKNAGSVNNYLATNSIKVKPYFANLSNVLHFPISVDHIVS